MTAPFFQPKREKLTVHLNLLYQTVNHVKHTASLILDMATVNRTIISRKPVDIRWVFDIPDSREVGGDCTSNCIQRIPS